jgi:hypothetical protein
MDVVVIELKDRKHAKGLNMISKLKVGALVLISVGFSSPALAMTQEQKGKMNFAGMCTAFADEGNKILKAKGKTSSFDVISVAAANDIKMVRTLPGAMDAYNGFYKAAVQGLAGTSDGVKTAMITQFLSECAKKYGVQ